MSHQQLSTSQEKMNNQSGSGARQRATELRREASRCQELARRKNDKVGEKERESRRMHGEAVRVENHAEQLKRDRARALERISSEEKNFYKTSLKHFNFAEKQLHIDGCVYDIRKFWDLLSLILKNNSKDFFLQY